MNSTWRLPARLLVTILLIAIGVLVILLPYLLRRQRLPSLSVAETFVDSAFVTAGTPLPESAAVMAALSRVIDPEVGISIVDLGLVDSVRIDSSGSVGVAVALTTPECPLVSQLGSKAAKEVIAVPGVRRVEVRMDPTLPWDPNQLSPAARERYRSMFRNTAPVPHSSLLSPPSSHDSGTSR